MKDHKDKWTKTATYKTWKRSVNHYKAKTKKQPKRHNDMCNFDNFCKGTKDIQRKLMPQIYNVNKFSRNIKKYGLKTKKTTATVKNLIPSQNEINRKIVNKIIKKMKKSRSKENPLVISKDNYIIDGHHRWAAHKKMNPKKKLPVVVVNAPINDALGASVVVAPNREAF